MNRYVVIPHHGAGRARLVRQGRTVLFTTSDGPAAAALAGWCRLFGDRSTDEILHELERVTTDNPTLGAFALLVLDDDGIEVAVNGALPLAAQSAAGTDRLQLGDGFSQQRLTDVSVVALVVPGAVVDPLLELERGVIAADGFEVRVVQPSAAGSPWAPPATAAPEAPETPPADVAPAADGPAHVLGLRCSRGHFNDPRAHYCGVCGVEIHQASFVLVDDERPPLGMLVFGDGAHYELSDELVLGRDPSEDPVVRSGSAIGIALSDPTNTLSRVHAELRLVDWDVQLVDRNSTNGTFVWGPGQTVWERLAPSAPRVLQPGTHVSFGRLTATFETARRES
jgi:hypothetical protein